MTHRVLVAFTGKAVGLPESPSTITSQEYAELAPGLLVCFGWCGGQEVDSEVDRLDWTLCARCILHLRVIDSRFDGARMVSLAELAQITSPSRTVLFFGAGASVPSGAPTSEGLANRLCDILAKGERISDDLTEVCSILENRYGRKELVKALRSVFHDLQPSRGLLTLPEFDWPVLYTTNFDQLIEAAYRKCGKNLVPIRSNFDYGRSEASEGVPLFKIHGCISQDSVDGSHARMVLTERDYEEYKAYRETLFARLDLDLTTKSVLIIGHSLRDPHLRRDMATASELHQKKGAPGRLCALVYDRDPDRAQLLERKGFTVAFGGIDEFLYEFTSAHPPSSRTTATAGEGFQLPARARPSTIEVAHARTLPSNALRLFNGSPATYADVRQGLTFRRTLEAQLLNKLLNEGRQFATVTGVAGVGKTTLARRVLDALVSDHNFLAWEHSTDFPFKSGDWIEVERTLREAGRRGVLLIDDCPEFLRQVNLLAESLAKVEAPALYLVLTANSAQWSPRVKASELFAKGIVERLSDLGEGEVEELVRLVDTQPEIRALVDPYFSHLSRVEQVQQLRNRCSADMYVCLKNIFATDALDTILLREYAGLTPEMQDIYRHVAALEAAGARVHRQLVIRVLGVQPDKIRSLLDLLEGLVEEYDIKPADGLYGWATRHEVIAQTISRWKFADDNELFSLFVRVVSSLNPTVWLELRTIRDICGPEFGIGRLIDHTRQISLFESLIKLAPGERVPRHRLISKLLFLGQLEAAAQAIRAAEEAVGFDSPINRFKIRLLLRRAETTEGILEEDRRAMLLEAQRLAITGITRLPQEKYAYIAYSEVGLAFADRTGQTEILDDAIRRMRDAADRILDPELTDAFRSVERTRRRFSES